MKYLILLLILISTITLYAQALPRSIFLKLQTADGSIITPSDISIRAYFKERPQEIQTNIMRPKNIKSFQSDSPSHKGFYVNINLAAFRAYWAIGDTIIADITQLSTGATVHFVLEIPTGGTIWIEHSYVLLNPNPNIASDPIPIDKSNNVPTTLADLGWSFLQDKGYSKPYAFRLAIDTDSLFTNATVLYIKSNGKQEYSHRLPKKLLPLKENTTYYWKVFPTVSHDEDISISSLHPILIDGKPIKALRSGDADGVPLWRFSVGK